MKSDFLLAITQLSAEKGLPKEVVLNAVEAALASAYRKNNFAPNQKVAVRINPNTGKVEVWAEKTVVEQPVDSRCEISLEEARRIKSDAEVGEAVTVEATPHNAGRIAAQTAKQVILQRLHEAEHSAILEEYAGREGDIISGTVQRIEQGQVIIDLGRTEAILPTSEQVRSERYRAGQRLRVYLLEVARTGKGPRVVVSRSHPDLLRRLLELEIPEVLSGVVELKMVAREAGYRSKVAVAARQSGIDPVGCCVGLRGIRIQNIVNELNGEKLDVVTWHPDTRIFIANALSPAQVLSVELDEKEEVATVVVPDRQLSLAIGKEGQNARLAAKLTGWRIDIKSASVAEAERAEAAKAPGQTKAKKAEILAEAEEAGAEVEPAEALAEIEEVIAEELPAEVSPVPEAASVSAEAIEEPAEPAPAVSLDEAFAGRFETPAVEDKSPLRFAEDIITRGPARAGAKSKKKSTKVTYGKDRAEDSAKPKKGRREVEAHEYEDEF